MGEVVKGSNLWGALEGQKGSLKDSVEIKLGDVVGEITTHFVDVDVINKINNEYESKFPKKPTHPIETKRGVENIQFPIDENDSKMKKYKPFENNPEVQKKITKWEEKCEPIDIKRQYRLAYEFIIPEERPGKNPEEGVKIMMDGKDGIGYMNMVNILQSGMSLNGMDTQLGKLENDS